MNKSKPVPHDQVVATLAASVVMKRVVDEIPDLINYAVKEAERRKEAPPPEIQTSRNYLPAPIPEVEPCPAMLAGRWSSKKGESLGSAVLVNSTGDILIVNQYENDCAILKKNKVPTVTFKSEFSIWGAEKKVEFRQVITDFKVMAGEINLVVAKLGTKGWKLKPVVPKQQLELIVGGAA